MQTELVSCLLSAVIIIMVAFLWSAIDLGAHYDEDQERLRRAQLDEEEEEDVG